MNKAVPMNLFTNIGERKILIEPILIPKDLTRLEKMFKITELLLLYLVFYYF